MSTRSSQRPSAATTVPVSTGTQSSRSRAKTSRQAQIDALRQQARDAQEAEAALKEKLDAVQRSETAMKEKFAEAKTELELLQEKLTTSENARSDLQRRFTGNFSTPDRPQNQSDNPANQLTTNSQTSSPGMTVQPSSAQTATARQEEGDVEEKHDEENDSTHQNHSSTSGSNLSTSSALTGHAPVQPNETGEATNSDTNRPGTGVNNPDPSSSSVNINCNFDTAPHANRERSSQHPVISLDDPGYLDADVLKTLIDTPEYFQNSGPGRRCLRDSFPFGHTALDDSISSVAADTGA